MLRDEHEPGLAETAFSTWGAIRMGVVALLGPLVPWGLLADGKLLLAAAFAVAIPALWIDLAARLGYESELARSVGTAALTAAAVLFVAYLIFEFHWSWREYLVRGL